LFDAAGQLIGVGAADPRQHLVTPVKILTADTAAED
jgi:hypothetical protein